MRVCVYICLCNEDVFMYTLYMYLCVYICVYICLCVYMLKCAGAFVGRFLRGCIHVHKVYIFVYVCLCVSKFVRRGCIYVNTVYMHLCVHTCVSLYVLVCIYVKMRRCLR